MQGFDGNGKWRYRGQMVTTLKRAHRTRVVVIALGLFYAGCSIRQPVQIQTVFDRSEHEPYTEPGENSIKGQGFLRQQGGGVVTCAGSEVLMIPATSFFREVVMYVRAGNAPHIAEKIFDPAFKSIIKHAQCDAQGNFSFSKLPSGAWFVLTDVSWVVGYARQGGVLTREVTLSNNETAQVLLTEKDFVGR